MRDQLSMLFELQKLDTSIDRHRRNIASLDDGTQARAALTRATTELEALQQKLATDEAALKDKELQLKSTEQEREQKRKRAAGASSNAREVVALDKKIDELTRLKGKLEEDTLLLMDEVEAGRAATEKAQKAASAAGAKAREIEATYASARERLKKEAAELTAQRDELAPRIAAALLTQYESIRARADGLGIVEIKGGGTCGGCQTAVPTSNVAAARDGKFVVKCESCRRILFVP